MTNGLSIQLEPTTEIELPTIDHTNFALWIELQPVATLAGLLDLIGNECYRRELFAAGHDLKQIVTELRA